MASGWNENAVFFACGMITCTLSDRTHSDGEEQGVSLRAFFAAASAGCDAVCLFAGTTYIHLQI